MVSMSVLIHKIVPFDNPSTRYAIEAGSDTSTAFMILTMK
jgi:hypothetical protein